MEASSPSSARTDEHPGADTSVLVVVLGATGGRHLEDCIRALETQTQRDLTVAFVAEAETIAAAPTEAFGSAVVEVGSIAAMGAAADELLEQSAQFDVVVFIRDDSICRSEAVAAACDVMARTGAGAVGAKVVDATDPDMLVEVGMSADRFATPYSRLEGTELDQEQYDVTRQTLFASFAFLAIRSDLLRQVGGFDPELIGPGAELDICWRLRLAGYEVLYTSQVVVAQCEPGLLEEPDVHTELVRRNRLRTTLKNYGFGPLVLTSFQSALLAVAQALAAFLTTRKIADAKTYLRPWTWNLRRLGDLRRSRKLVARNRKAPDKTITRLMLAGAARLRTAGDERVAETGETRLESAGRSFSEAYRSIGGHWVAALLALLLFVLLAGRSLISGTLPTVKGLSAPSGSGLGLIGDYLAPWRDVEMGTRAATPAGVLLTGMFGFLTLGSAALAQKILLFGGIPTAAIMCARSLRPTIGSRGARAVGAAFYALVPLWWNAVAKGELGVVVVAILLPTIARRMAHLSGLGAYAEDVPPLRRKLELAALLGVVMAAEPASIWAVLLILAGWVLASVMAGGTERCLLTAWDLLQALLGALVLLFPWSLELLFDAPQAMGSVQQPLDFSAVLRFDTGRVGNTILVYGVLVAAVLPILVTRGARFAWATRWWGVVLLSFFAAWLVSRGVLPNMSSPEVLLAPAALGVAMLVAWGGEGIRRDLPELGFGVRQPVAFVLMGVGVLGLVAPLVVLPAGRLGLPPTDWQKQLTWQPAEAEHGQFLDLFIGSDVPGQPRRLGDQVAFLASGPGGPHLEDQWLPPGNPGVDQLREVAAAIADGRAPNPGRLLAPFGVRYIIVPTGNPELVSSLGRALDLKLTFPDDRKNGSIYENLAWRPRVGTVDAPLPADTQGLAEMAALTPPRWVDAWMQSGRADWQGPSGQVVAAALPDGSGFRLVADGRTVQPGTAYGWAMQFPDTPVSEDAHLELDAGPWHLLAVLMAGVCWLVVLGGIYGLRGRNGTTSS